MALHGWILIDEEDNTNNINQEERPCVAESWALQLE